MVERKISNLSAGVRFPYPAQILHQNLSEAPRPKGGARSSLPSRMFTVYILQSLKDNKTYTGYTDNFERRFHEHNAGKSSSTKHRAPFKLLFKEEFKTTIEAKKRELWWKSGAGRRKLKEYFQKNLQI